MSAFWIFVWVVLSAILLGASIWSFQILTSQKKAWKAYAARRRLIYQQGTLMGPAEMSGVIDDYKISFYTAQRQNNDSRNKRYVSVVELTAPEGLFDGGVAGTKEMQIFMQSLNKLHPYTVVYEGWNPDHTMFMKDDAVANAYFTPERLEIFSSVLKTRNADVLIVFNDKEMTLRLETTDPMQSADKIDKIVTRLIGLSNKMRITPEQRKEYMAFATPE